MKIGLCLNEYASRYPLETAAQYLRADGYDAVDCSELHNVLDAIYTDPESAVEKRLAEKKRILSENGVSIAQVHGPWRYPPEDGTPEGRAEWLDYMKRCVRMASCLGAPYMVVHPLMPFGENSPENPAKVIDLNVEHYMRLASYAKDHNITVCLENMPFPQLPLAHVDQIAEFVDGLGMKNLKVCLDTGHASICGMPLYDAVRLLGNRLATLHVHDNHGVHDEHLPPLAGTADFKGFAAALKEIGFAGVISAEAHVGNDLNKRDFRVGARAMAKTLADIASNSLK